jgi:hypothetical protein
MTIFKIPLNPPLIKGDLLKGLIFLYPPLLKGALEL